MQKLSNTHIALVATDDFEDSELVKPFEALKEAGVTVSVISNKEDTITGKNGTDISVDNTVGNVSVEDFDGLMLPGGVGNPDTLRIDPVVVQFIKGFFEQHKPVAAICHAPWLLIEADVVRGRQVTSWPSLKTDLINAGAIWVDEQVVTDQGLVTSRKPDDIPVFIDKMIEEFAEGPHVGQTT